jgi:thiamine-monophosphate kinase
MLKAGAGASQPRAAATAESPVERYRRPTPRVKLGQVISRGRAARAAIDLSDGLADAIRQLASASRCGADIDLAAVPVDEAARQWWTEGGVDPLMRALEGGDDYELLFAVPKRWTGRLRSALRHGGGRLTKIGTLTKQQDRFTVTRNGAAEDLPAGFEHFRDTE